MKKDKDVSTPQRKAPSNEIACAGIRVPAVPDPTPASSEVGKWITDAVGIPDVALATNILGQTLATLPQNVNHPASQNLLLVASTFREIGPKDGLESMLAGQMVATHNLAMRFLGRASSSENIDVVIRNVEVATKLQRTYIAQIEALNRHRGKGQQKVTVEHVTVNAGGQAVVGNFEAGTKTVQGPQGSALGGDHEN